MKMKIKYLILITIIIIFSVSNIRGQVGFTVGNEYGIGLVAQVGSPKTKLEVGGGLSPLLVFWNITLGDDYIKFYLPFTVGAGVNIALTPSERKDRMGLKFEANYNTIMKTGFGGGVDYQLLDKPYKIVIGGGFLYFPNAYDELLDRLNEEENTYYSKDDVSAVFLNFRPYVNISIYFGK